MKTTTFSAFKAIATVALICIIGLNKSKAQNGPVPSSTYTIQNNTTCTYIVDIDERDAAGCPILFTHTGITIFPGANTIVLSTLCAFPNLCDIDITINGIVGCGPIPPATVSFSSPTTSGGCPGVVNPDGTLGCAFVMLWGQFSSVIQ